MIEKKKYQLFRFQPCSGELLSVFYINILNNYSFEAYDK